MNEVQALDVLKELRPQVDGCLSFVGLQDSRAYMRIERENCPDKWAAVYTPGQGYFSVQTEGNLTYDYVDDDASDEEVRETLTMLTAVAVNYVLGRAEEVRSPRFGVPSLRIRTEDEPVTLKLPGLGALSYIFRRFRRRNGAAPRS
jgi:hypothetical protein